MRVRTRGALVVTVGSVALGWARRAGRPLVARTTWRRWAHAILGAALLMPFFLFGAGITSVLGSYGTPNDGAWVALATFVLVLPLAGGAATVLPAVRALESVAARELLDVPRDQLGDEARSWEARQRTATWFVLHVALGGILGGLTLVVPVLTVLLGVAPVAATAADTVPFGLGPEWGPLVGVVVLAGYLYLVAGAGGLMSWLAPRLLGPTDADRLARLSLQTARLAGRNQLARELHDSVGHALSIITVQAGAARRVGSGAEAPGDSFVGSALEAIEEAARGALEELDHVLGVLRASASESGGASADPSSPDRPTRPQPTLGDLDPLVRATRAAGVDVDATVSPDIETVPAAVSREAYRIVQEGLTNALRHAGRVPVALRVTVLPGALELELTNPVVSGGPPRLAGAAGAAGAATGDRRIGGRGLAGIHERVAVLGGDVTASRDGDRWRVAVSLPLRSSA
jgi:signal transduction histidine kinase